MRFSLVALAGLAAFGDHLSVQARASSNEFAVTSTLPTRNDAPFSILEDMKRRLVSVLPRAPAVVPMPLKPVVVKPPPIRPGTGDPSSGPPPAVKPIPGNDGPDGPAKPAPLKPVNDPVDSGAVCKLQTKRSRLLGRATYTKADASNPAKIMEWLIENEEYLKTKNNGVTKNKLVFFSTGSNDMGETMANNFIDKNPGYGAFDDVFGSKFSKDFGRVAPREGDVGKATSKALAQWAKDPIVFNTKAGKSPFPLF